MLSVQSKAMFIGKDGSMGLTHGRKYSIAMSKGDYKGLSHVWVAIVGKDIGIRVCPYASNKLMLENWRLL